MPFDDELPQAPTGGEPATGTAFDDTIDSSTFEGVGKIGDAMPKGTYHFRLDSYTQEVTENGPYFNIRWKCQEEPQVGRLVFDICTWVSAETVKAAAAGDAQAKSTIGTRLARANSIMDAAGFKPQGKFGFKSFLDTNPELKLTIGISERKKKVEGKTDSKGKQVYEGTGEMGNNVVKYLSLHRPS